MAVVVSHPLADKSIVQALVSDRLITRDQAREILFKSDSLKKRLQARRKRQLEAGEIDFFLSADSITLLDVLTDHSLHRIGDTFRDCRKSISSACIGLVFATYNVFSFTSLMK